MAHGFPSVKGMNTLFPKGDPGWCSGSHFGATAPTELRHLKIGQLVKILLIVVTLDIHTIK